jgi:very-short-patch-repair endonuclease
MFARPERRFRADFCWPEYGLIVEVQGGGWVGGRHHKAAGYMADCERLYEAMRRGWRVLYVVPDHIDSGEAIKWIRELLPMGGSVELPEQPVPKGQKG